MTTSASVGDRTVNRVALCSAIFAGVAYVGYSYVRQAFGRRGRRAEALEYDPDGVRNSSGRVYLRRLSGSDATSSTEALLGTLEGDGNAARLVLRPLSVQERLRELNLRARHFAETILAVQLQHSPSADIRTLQYTRSLQTSPTRFSPLSPIDITHLGSSRCSSIDNLSLVEGSINPDDFRTRSLPRGFRKRLSRRSLRSRHSSSGGYSTKEEQDEIEALGERLLDEREAELKKRLKGFEDGTTKIFTPYEAKSLVALLHSKDPHTLEKALVTISNSAAFTKNQDNLRESGCIVRLQHLVDHSDSKVQLAALIAVSNMALNTSNQKEMGDIVPRLLPILQDISDSSSSSDSSPVKQNGHAHLTCQERIHLVHQTLFALTNIAALTDWHMQFKSALSRLLDLTQSSCAKIRMQSLRLLVNLSTNEEMVPHLLATKAPEYIWLMLDETLTDDELLRVVTLLSNMICTAHNLKIDHNNLPADIENDKGSIRSSAIYDEENLSDVMEHLQHIMTSHTWEDVRVKARMVYNVLKLKQDNADKI